MNILGCSQLQKGLITLNINRAKHLSCIMLSAFRNVKNVADTCSYNLSTWLLYIESSSDYNS
jgi:hypothetical protein